MWICSVKFFSKNVGICHKMPFAKIYVCACIYIYRYHKMIHASMCKYLFSLNYALTFALLERSVHHFSLVGLNCDKLVFLVK